MMTVIQSMEGTHMKIQDAVVVITGANRGIGKEFALQFLRRGAKRVYGTARDPRRMDVPGVTPIALDVTSATDATAAARIASDATLVINNAGIADFGGLLGPEREDVLRRHLETNVFGALRVASAFAPVLAKNGGGALLNVASVASFVSSPTLANYAVSKSALWSVSNGLRHELRAQGTKVFTLHMGFVDTDMTQAVNLPKSTPAEIVSSTLDALERGEEEILADAFTRQVKQALVTQPPVYVQPR
jgi:NAD(P)-dependent dehydrogenase (short-subunit alcohol dehydrogenase family)